MENSLELIKTMAKTQLFQPLYLEIFKPKIVFHFRPDFKNQRDYQTMEILFYDYILDIIKNNNLLNKAKNIVDNFKNNNSRDIYFGESLEDKITYFLCMIYLSDDFKNENINESQIENWLSINLKNIDFFKSFVEKYLEES